MSDQTVTTRNIERARMKIQMGLDTLEAGLHDLVECKSAPAPEPEIIKVPVIDRNPYSYMIAYDKERGRCKVCGKWFGLSRGGFVQHVRTHISDLDLGKNGNGSVVEEPTFDPSWEKLT